jgi:hypothetical protein
MNITGPPMLGAAMNDDRSVIKPIVLLEGRADIGLLSITITGFIGNDDDDVFPIKHGCFSVYFSAFIRYIM